MTKSTYSQVHTSKYIEASTETAQLHALYQLQPCPGWQLSARTPPWVCVCVVPGTVSGEWELVASSRGQLVLVSGDVEGCFSAAPRTGGANCVCSLYYAYCLTCRSKPCTPASGVSIVWCWERARVRPTRRGGVARQSKAKSFPCKYKVYPCYRSIGHFHFQSSHLKLLFPSESLISLTFFSLPGICVRRPWASARLTGNTGTLA